MVFVMRDNHGERSTLLILIPLLPLIWLLSKMLLPSSTAPTRWEGLSLSIQHPCPNPIPLVDQLPPCCRAMGAPEQSPACSKEASRTAPAGAGGFKAPRSA